VPVNDDHPMEHTPPSEPVELSQPHSLWSEEMGEVERVDPTAVQFSPLIPPSQDASQHTAAFVTLTVEKIVKMKIKGSTKAASVKDASSSDLESDEPHG
jgi:hypothetical protein